MISPDLNLDRKPKEIFTEIYKKNRWRSDESVSGIGSILSATRKVRSDIEYLIEKYQIVSILDIPCGDFNWMKEVKLAENQVHYLGCDIVPELIEKNKINYTNDYIKFKEVDLINDNLPEHDLVICRDCLVHFSYEDIRKAIQNIKNSNSKYLLVTSFLNIVNNEDIKTGWWRPIDLRKPPFNYLNPIEIFDEEFTEYLNESNKHLKKAMLLYKIKDL